ncbi:MULTISPECIES: chorismate synthase [Deinococcus]|uniref:Chorismate synthase n=1 Tax=Deinococcus geothermalis (strain DSM 11300 / CIP 105573 / AG-3a) TaxID=319795 RepID=AROC_DEIGD|nr:MULTISPECIES: chorismate synthase [Deinococcus]Q1IXK9.1 RecName: Full=Chorismate synthase; Short=CS; AltName: Full=5-enolpyruvylshikimate-3-phosphate phospholyase [Deinococcus geothermalis DSM 11300]ABF46025.1 Chorismate synthase [Deinococcus geothermalis DSM 11300]MBI0445332.1 chorismate synthase [Deinococcus sp. DB0503]
MRYLTAGESHGPQLTAIIEGLPSQLPLGTSDINPWLRKRQGGYGRGRRMVIETDEAQILSGVRAGRTTGAPVTLVIANKDHRNWTEIMSPEPGGEPRKKALTAARPGHADLTGGIKYRHKDLRDVLERASARETAARVAVGAVALKLLSELGVEGANYVASLGGIETRAPFSWDQLDAIEASDLRTPDADAAAQMRERIDQAKKDGDTLGGILEVRFRGLPVGLGSYVHWDRKLDGRIAQACLSVQAMKGVEIGRAFENAVQPGSRVHDAVYYREGTYVRDTNSAGGLEAGMTNGEELIVRVAMKPIATLMKPLPTVNVVTHEAADAARERSDTTAVPAAGVILQCVIGWVLAEAMLEKFGGDTLPELQERVQAARAYAQAY